MLNLYKTLLKPHVEYSSCSWNPYYKKGKELLERIQHRYTIMIIDVQDKIYTVALTGHRSTVRGQVKLFEVMDIIRVLTVEVIKMYRDIALSC